MHNHIHMLTMLHIWTLKQTCRHKYTSSIHFVCIYIIRPGAQLRSAVRARLGWIGRVSQRSRGSQIYGVEGLQLLQYSTSRALIKYQKFIS